MPTTPMERAAEASLALLQRTACAGDSGDVLERDGDPPARERERLDREDALLDLVVAVLDLAGVDQSVFVSTHALKIDVARRSCRAARRPVVLPTIDSA